MNVIPSQADASIAAAAPPVSVAWAAAGAPPTITLCPDDNALARQTGTAFIALALVIIAGSLALFFAGLGRHGLSFMLLHLMAFSFLQGTGWAFLRGGRKLRSFARGDGDRMAELRAALKQLGAGAGTALTAAALWSWWGGAH